MGITEFHGLFGKGSMMNRRVHYLPLVVCFCACFTLGAQCLNFLQLKKVTVSTHAIILTPDEPNSRFGIGNLGTGQIVWIVEANDIHLTLSQTAGTGSAQVEVSTSMFNRRTSELIVTNLEDEADFETIRIDVFPGTGGDESEVTEESMDEGGEGELETPPADEFSEIDDGEDAAEQEDFSEADELGTDGEESQDPFEEETDAEEELENSPLVFDAAADFSSQSNPARAWSYGWFDNIGSDFQLFAQFEILFNVLPAWTNGANEPNVMSNQSGSTEHPDNSSTIEPGQLTAHPGPSGEYGVIRWTSPASGRYEITGSFEGISGYQGNPVTTTNVVIFHDSRFVYAAEINVNNNDNSASFSLELDVIENEPIDFAVGDGGNGFSHDSTALDAVITLY